MTEKRKTFSMLIFTTVLAVIAVVYGFSTIPNPAMQREFKLDHKRVSDLGELQFSIDEYYRTNGFLPASLNEVTTNSYSYSQKLAKNDPVTNQPYEYAVLNDNKYQLCATFTTDSAKELDSYDNENYNYTSFRDKFVHGSGRHCFDFTTPRDYDQPTTITEPVSDISGTTKPATPPARQKKAQ